MSQRNGCERRSRPHFIVYTYSMKIINWLNQPKVLEWIHGGLVIFWIILWISAAIFGWVSSVIFVSHLSLVALVLASLASWQAARGEVKQDENNED